MADLSWHWQHDGWYWDDDGDGWPPWDSIPATVVMLFAPTDLARLESVLASCRDTGATSFAARDGGARASVPIHRAAALLSILGEDLAPVRVKITSVSVADAVEIERICSAAGRQTIVDGPEAAE